MFRHYRFIDYATQGYLLFVAVLILFFHNGTVPVWPWLLSAHILCLGVVHWLILNYSRGNAGKVITFFRHFYPVLLYTGMFRETGALNESVPFFGYINSDTLITKAGDLLNVLQVVGRDHEGLDVAQLDHLTKRIEAAFRLLGPRYRVYQILFKRNWLFR